MLARMLVVVLVGCAGTPIEDVTPPAERVEQVPDVTLVDATGATFNPVDHIGTPMVIEFSAAWCGRCNDAAPEVEAIWQARPDLVVWSVLFDDWEGDDPDGLDLSAWADAFGLTHPVLGDVDRAAFDAFGGGHQPVFHVVDAEGRIAWTDDGNTAEEVLAALDQL